MLYRQHHTIAVKNSRKVQFENFFQDKPRFGRGRQRNHPWKIKPTRFQKGPRIWWVIGAHLTLDQINELNSDPQVVTWQGLDDILISEKNENSRGFVGKNGLAIQR